MLLMLLLQQLSASLLQCHIWPAWVAAVSCFCISSGNNNKPYRCNQKKYKKKKAKQMSLLIIGLISFNMAQQISAGTVCEIIARSVYHCHLKFSEVC
jgi:hypothetical protein